MIKSGRYRELALRAFGEANRLRQHQQHDLYSPVCPFDLASECELQVRFVSLASLEGAYVSDIAPERIVVGSLRPAGRQRFTAAHELGHYVFGHGTCLDEVVEVHRRDPYQEPEELLADIFAGALLMPKFTIEAGLAARGWSTADLGPLQLYVLAGWLGVGYGTLVRHLQLSLGMLPRHRAEELLRTQPKKIRHMLLDRPWSGDVFVVDEHWSSRPLDLQVGDAIVTPQPATRQGHQLRRLGDLAAGGLFEAVCQGRGQLQLNEGSGRVIEVRIALRNASGLYEYRYEEDSEYVDDTTTT